jgi:formiminoglutamase
MNFSDYTNPFKHVSSSFSPMPGERQFGTSLKTVRNNEIDFDVAIIGVKNDVNATHNKGCGLWVDAVREELYALKGPFKNLYVSDLGNLKAEKARDCYFALQELVLHLVENRVIPIIIGGSHDFTLPLIQALNVVKQQINLVCIDQSLDALESEDFDHKTWLREPLSGKWLESFSLIGYQSYLFDDEAIRAFPYRPYSLIRLGEVRKNLHNIEPVVRDADLVSLDMGVTRLSDAPGVRFGSPNGLFGEELCQLTRYCGFSDSLKCFGVFETNETNEGSRQTVRLAAQAIWHFIDGLDKRYKDYPVRDIASYKKHVVHQSDIDTDIVFYNNPQNNRWWMEIVKDSPRVVSCTYDDYKDALLSKIPDTYLKWAKL